ncbi:hypothetical protein RhiirA4_474229 [Rhizophagus irregularis]|uniref:Uncharacterized protein n=1 Tax=Rhizophagus irregularis TaxID=588596 RepID=A0A2I1H832_9GLOM|nr:hypothetical protein RhiirA4_474229 [Rhizophagus irregularis]
MFDAKLTASDIKKRYEWQAYRKLNEEENKNKDYDVLKTNKLKYGGHFSKIIKVNKIKYILMLFNNENDLLKAIYKSTMDESLGEGLKIKSQDELIGEEETYKKKFGINRFKLPQQASTSKAKDKFYDAPSDPISTMTLEEHEELDNLNKNFSKNLEEVNKNIKSEGKGSRKRRRK